MHEVYSIISIALFASPIVIGAAGFFAIWFNEEFWQDELYNYDEN